MKKERKKVRLELLLDRFAAHFWKLILVNLIFAVPSAVVFVIVYFGLSRLVPADSNLLTIIYMTSIILLMPFYSGVVVVARNIARGDKEVTVFKTYATTFKQNFLSFLLHGVVIFVAAVISMLSISLYISLLGVHWMFYLLLFFAILISLLILFAVYYVPLMSVTFDIKPFAVYKNSFLMSFGEFKNNLFATIGLFVASAVIFMFCAISALSKSSVVMLAVPLVLWAVLIPSTCTFVVIFFIYDGMYNLITKKDERQKEIAERMANDGKPVEKPKVQTEDFSDIDPSTLRDPDGYIYHNGRMVKQSTILRYFEQKRKEEEE